MIVGATTGWHRREASPWDFLSLKMEIFVNPMLEGLHNKVKYMWPAATLAPLLDSIMHIVTLGSKSSINDVPWINDRMKWLAQTSTLQIFLCGYGFLVVSVLVYLAILVVRMLRWSKVDGAVPDINNYASYAKQLAECPTEDVPGLIEEIKRKERDMKSKAPQSPQTSLFLANLSSALFLHFSSFFGLSFCMVQVEEPDLQVEPIGKCSCLSCITCRVACCSCVK